MICYVHRHVVSISGNKYSHRQVQNAKVPVRGVQYCSMALNIKAYDWLKVFESTESDACANTDSQKYKSNWALTSKIEHHYYCLI